MSRQRVDVLLGGAVMTGVCIVCNAPRFAMTYHPWKCLPSTPPKDLILPIAFELNVKMASIPSMLRDMNAKIWGMLLIEF